MKIQDMLSRLRLNANQNQPANRRSIRDVTHYQPIDNHHQNQIFPQEVERMRLIPLNHKRNAKKISTTKEGKV